jgi:hypothetical protein
MESSRVIQSLFRRNPDFIEIYDHALSQKECEILINYFEKSNEVQYGLIADGSYYPDRKKCLQIKLDLNDSSPSSNIVREKLSLYLNQYRKKYSLELENTQHWNFFPYAAFQKYDGKEDGFKTWHCEHGDGESDSKRIMAWMFYLNDAKCGTEFYNSPTIKAKRGRCVIWPAFWTHVHKGVTPNIGLKYIVTGWISYD